MGLRNYVGNSKDILLIATCTVEDPEDTETPNEYKKRKKSERKAQWNKNNYVDNLSGKQRAKKVEIGGDG